MIYKWIRTGIRPSKRLTTFGTDMTDMSKMCSLNFFDDVIHHLVKDPFTDSLIFVEAFVEVPRGDAQESLEVEAAGSQESPEAVEA